MRAVTCVVTRWMPTTAGLTEALKGAILARRCLSYLKKAKSKIATQLPQTSH